MKKTDFVPHCPAFLIVVELGHSESAKLVQKDPSGMLAAIDFLNQKQIVKNRYGGRMPNRHSFDLQSEILSQILVECSKMGGKILSLHGVRAWSELLDLLENHLNFTRWRVILHWFSGSNKQMERAMEMGCYFSLNIKSFQSKSSQSIIKNLPMNKVLTETDGPFVKIGQRSVHPKDVSSVVKLCAQFWGLKPKEAANKILDNCRQIVSV